MARYFSEDPEYSKVTPAEKAIRDKMMAIMAQFTRTFHAGYGYSSDDGIREDDYDDVAEAIMDAFGMVPKE